MEHQSALLLGCLGWHEPHIVSSFDHIVSASQERRRNSQSKCLGGLQIDDQLWPDALLDGEVSRF
jgi:hypothetical protein